MDFMVTKSSLAPGPGDALIIVDVQQDFLPGGHLAVPDGDQVVPVLNRYADLFSSLDLPVYATRDWHPAEHCSFQNQGGDWPPHCLAGSEGAAFAPELRLPESTVVIDKATARDVDAYSGFEGTDLEVRLRDQKIERVYVGGLATDYCVLNTVRDALQRGFRVALLADAIRAVNVNPGDGDRAVGEMVRGGAVRTEVGEILS